MKPWIAFDFVPLVKGNQRPTCAVIRSISFVTTLIIITRRVFATVIELELKLPILRAGSACQENKREGTSQGVGRVEFGSFDSSLIPVANTQKWSRDILDFESEAHRFGERHEERGVSLYECLVLPGRPKESPLEMKLQQN
eukprot:gene12354-biopygen289